MPLYRAQMVYDRPADVGEDVMVNSLHFAADDTTEAGAELLADYLTTWWTTGVSSAPSLRDKLPTAVRLRDVRVYNAAVEGGPLYTLDGTGYTPITGGFGTVPHPPQIALSITFKTTQRRRWGRIYLPYPGPSTGEKRPLDASCESICASTAAMSSEVRDVGTENLVHVIKWGGETVNYSVVTSIQVDNVYDVIRSRRFETTTYRAQADLDV